MTIKTLIKKEHKVFFQFLGDATKHSVTMISPTIQEVKKLRADWHKLGLAARDAKSELGIIEKMDDFDDFYISLLKLCIPETEVDGMDEDDWYQLVLQTGGVDGNLIRTAALLCGIRFGNIEDEEHNPIPFGSPESAA